MANEFIIKHGFLSKGNSEVTGSLKVTGSFEAQNISASGNLIGNTGSFDRTELGKSGALNGSIKFNTLHGPSYELIANNNSLTVSGTTGAPLQGFALDSQVENFSFLDGGTIRVLKGLTTGSGKGGGLHIQAQGSNQSNGKKGIFSTDTIGPYIGNSSYGSIGTHGTFRILNGLSSDNDADSGSFTSAEFGDYIKFNLPITASGNISSSGYVSASNFIGDGLTVTGDAQITGSLNVSGSTTISLPSGSAFSVIEEDAEATHENRLDFAYTQQDPTLTISARGATSLLHLKTAGSSTGTTFNSSGEIIRNASGVNYGIQLGPEFKPVAGNQQDLGFYNRRWKNLYINTGDKISFGVSNTSNIDLASLRHLSGTNTLQISGSSDVILDVKGVVSASKFTANSGSSAALPGYSFHHSSGTGLYSQGAGYLQLQVNGGGSPEFELTTGQATFRVPIQLTNNELINPSRIRGIGSITGSTTGNNLGVSSSLDLDGDLSISKTTGTGPPGTGTTHSIAVTVSDPGSGNKYFLDGTETDSIVMNAGDAYKFDQSAANNNGHPFRLSTGTDGSGTAPYEVGVTYGAGSPGNANAYTQISVTTSTTAPLYYYCTQHSGMGGSGQLTVDSGSLNPMAGFANITGSLNVTGSTTVVGNVTATSFTGNGANLTNVPSPFTAAGISGSLGSNAALIRSLTATSITGAFAEASGGFSTRVTTLESSGGGSGFPFSGDGVISGSLLISSSNVGGVSTASMTLQGSGSTIFEIQGSQGQLFSVTDDLIHDVFNVSDISGDTLLKVSGSGLVEIPVGPISSSGLLFISASENAGQSTYKTLVQDPATGRIYHTGSYNTGTGGGGGDTYTLQAEAKSGTSVPLKLDAASGTDSTVNLTEGSNITLTRNSANQITIASAAGGGGGEWKDLGTTITSSKDVQITGSLIASGSVVNFASASSVILPAETVPLINPKVEYLTISEITASGTTVPLPNSLTFVSSSAFEYLEIFINGLRLRYDIDFAPMSTSTVKYLTTIPSGSEVTYKSLKRE